MTSVSLRSGRCPYSSGYLDSSWSLSLTCVRSFNRSSSPAVKIFQPCLWNGHLGCKIRPVNPRDKCCSLISGHATTSWFLGRHWGLYPETSSISAVLMVVIASPVLSLFCLDFRLQIWIVWALTFSSRFMSFSLPLREMMSFQDNSMGFAVIFRFLHVIAGVCSPKSYQVACW